MAMVSPAGTRYRTGQVLGPSRTSLEWLEILHRPSIARKAFVNDAVSRSPCRAESSGCES